MLERREMNRVRREKRRKFKREGMVSMGVEMEIKCEEGVECTAQWGIKYEDGNW